MSYFVDLIKTLFEEDTPFVQTDNDQDCSFCPFMTLCGRNPRSY
jgi:CRISPR/Cas system-associated exonuclease Cas4 (RecB family)